ncbi:Electron transfer flavoprotein subunit beta [Klebsiella huaxiensis]|uniref:electron transfer flavoprotein subunit beta/FixA family protein n=1 Tax=Klebsiella huaxiensis TaxID=2153354 RepID=UPI00115843F0|nr:electron transfer flavoprotein subunit beta/FixA family protein [Klebsiella huaxiensis]VUS79533.1 Electron transfer flavoprotein subunit beta [Klebsiella huaxiensis]
MNILLAFKPEPDASMLAEKDWQAAALDTCGPDVSLLRSAIGADEQAAAALLLTQRGAGCEMTLTALSIGDERALHWLRYFAALGFERQVLLEAAGDLRFAPSFIAGQLADWQRSHGAELIVTGCQSSESQNGQTPFLLAEMLDWPCFTQVERFTLEPPFVVVEQRTISGIRRCRVRLPAVIAVRQCGEVALPVPGMRQRLAATKAEVVRQAVTVEVMPVVQCLRLTRPEQRRCAVIIEGTTAHEKARSLWENYLRQRMKP